MGEIISKLTTSANNDNSTTSANIATSDTSANNDNSTTSANIATSDTSATTKNFTYQIKEKHKEMHIKKLEKQIVELKNENIKLKKNIETNSIEIKKFCDTRSNTASSLFNFSGGRKKSKKSKQNNKSKKQKKSRKLKKLKKN